MRTSLLPRAPHPRLSHSRAVCCAYQGTGLTLPLLQVLRSEPGLTKHISCPVNARPMQDMPCLNLCGPSLLSPSMSSSAASSTFCHCSAHALKLTSCSFQVARELQREREHSSYLVDELKGALSSPRPMPVMGAALLPKGLPPALARRMSSVAGTHSALPHQRECVVFCVAGLGDQSMRSPTGLRQHGEWLQLAALLHLEGDARLHMLDDLQGTRAARDAWQVLGLYAHACSRVIAVSCGHQPSSEATCIELHVPCRGGGAGCQHAQQGGRGQSSHPQTRRPHPDASDQPPQQVCHAAVHACWGPLHGIKLAAMGQ